MCLGHCEIVKLLLEDPRVHPLCVPGKLTCVGLALLESPGSEEGLYFPQVAVLLLNDIRANPHLHHILLVLFLPPLTVFFDFCCPDV